MRKLSIVMSLVFLLAGAATAQTVATAPAPASSQVLGMLNFIHCVNHLETTLAFYHDVFGLDAQPRDFPNPQVGALNNAPGVHLRLAAIKLPDAGFGFELTEFSNVERKPGQALPTDPGAAAWIIHVRDMDSVLAAIKKSGAPVLSTHGEPVKLTTADGTVRSLLVRDPDGYMVQVIEVPASQATAPGIVQPGAGLALSVANMDTTLKFYRDTLGFKLTGNIDFAKDKSRLMLIGAPKGSEVRQMLGFIPGTKAHIEFYEYKGMTRTPFHLHPFDPGAPGMSLHVADLDGLLATLKPMGINFESANGQPIQFSATNRSIFVEDPNGLNIELYQTLGPANSN